MLVQILTCTDLRAVAHLTVHKSAPLTLVSSFKVDVSEDAADLEPESDNFRALQPLNRRKLLEVDTSFSGQGSVMNDVTQLRERGGTVVYLV